jgi:AhpD family alkylhydroperoxidase
MSSADRVATVRPVAEKDADHRVAAVFDDFKATRGVDSVPNFWRVLATNPDLLELVWSNVKRLMNPESVGRVSRLAPTTREAIALAVSATNGCAYCVNSHTAALKKLGADDETLGEILAIASLFNMTNALADGYQVTPDVLPE